MARFTWLTLIVPMLGACGSSNAGDLFGESQSGDGGLDGGAVKLDSGAVDSGLSQSGDAAARCSVVFDSPRPSQVLTLDDDRDEDCSNGVQLELVMRTNLDEGVEVELTVGDDDPITALVDNGEIYVAEATFPGSGDTQVSVRVPGYPGCATSFALAASCQAPPSCEITAPEGPVLNGEAAPNGDRTSAAGAPFAVLVEVSTDAPDGEQVLLSTGAVTLTTLVDDGLATFPEVVLAPDGDFSLSAECRSGRASTPSAVVALTVDASPPEIDETRLVPLTGQRFTFQEDADPQTPELEFDVCVPVLSDDAIDLQAGAASNLCVSVGAQAPTCAAATSGGYPGGDNGGCVRLLCPGGAPFELNLRVSDASGNLRSAAITGVTCSSTAPLVQIVNLGDATIAPLDLSLRMLASSMPDGQLRDENAQMLGAQHDVVACTDKATGSAVLLGGIQGGALAVLGEQSSVSDAAPGECPQALPFVARFPLVTLPESIEGQSGALVSLSELQVEVTADGETNRSGPVRLWIDSFPPSVALLSPSRSLLCETSPPGSMSIAHSVRLDSSAYPAPVQAYVQSGSIAGSSVSFSDQNDAQPLSLAAGDELVATTTEPSGNVGQLPSCVVPGFQCNSQLVAPAQGQVFTLADDLDGDCANGIQVDFAATTNAADGTNTELSVAGGAPLSADVSGGAVSFTDVTVAAKGPTSLDFSVAGANACGQSVTVMGECDVAPTCSIQSPTQAVLNGVAAPAGDRVSSDGAPFRVAIVVATDAPDGEQVVLDTGSDSVLGTVTAGVATFASVLLAPDGDHTVTAECFSGSLSTLSSSRDYTVDSTAPEIDSTGVLPVDGQRYTRKSDVNPGTSALEFDVCVPVLSSDALDLPGAAANNLCVAIGTQAPTCNAARVAGLTGGVDGGCVRMTCPGSAAFSLNVSVLDAAGNVGTDVISGVSCSSTAPSVAIVNIVDATASPGNVARRLLSAGMPGGQMKDADAAVFGAQHDVVACTDATSGTARLLAGPAGSPLSQIATLASLAAAGPSECAVDLPRVARFVLPTLPESVEGPDGSLLSMTELQVEVTAGAEKNVSGAVRLWVDSVPPAVSLITPTAASLCGSSQPGNSSFVQSVRLSSSAYPAVLAAVVNNGGTAAPAVNFTGPSTAQNLTFPVGNNTLLATTAELSGNSGQLPTCTVYVGDPPDLTWVQPASDTIILNAETTAAASGTVQDADDLTPGWQGLLEITVGNLDSVDVASGSVQFELDGAPLGSALPLSGGVGDNTTRTVTLDTADIVGGIPESTSVVLGAKVLGTAASPSTTLDLVVDTIIPGALTTFVPQVGTGPTDRRETRFVLNWTAAGDGLSGSDTVAGYRIAFAPTPLTDPVAFEAAFTDADPLTPTGPLALSGVPAAPGASQQLSVRDLEIQRAYYFAAQAIDAGQNVGPLLQGTSGQAGVTPAVQAAWIPQILTQPDAETGTEFGFSIDGSTDLTGDGLSDLVVGSNHGDKVYIYLGRVNGFSAVPIVTIQGPPGVQFGNSVAVVGDINDDEPASPNAAQVAQAHDLVIIARSDVSGTGAKGSAYVFYGRDWEAPANSSLSTASNDHDATIGLAMPDGAFAGMTSAVRLGDFNGDGSDDFALAAPLYDPGAGSTFEGAVFVVFGGSVTLPFASFTLPHATRGYSIFGGTAGDAFGNTNQGARPLIGMRDLFGAGASGLMVAMPFNDLVHSFRHDALQSSLTTADAQDTFLGPAATFTGNFGMAISSGDVYSVANPNHITAPASGGGAAREGSVDVFRSLSSDSLPTPFTRLVDTRVADNFGQVLIGNNYSGRPGSYATPFGGLLTDNDPDLVLSSGTYNAGLPRVILLKGSYLNQLSGDVNLGVDIVGQSEYDMTNLPGPPSGWLGSIGYGLRDINGDGYGDVCIAEFQPDLPSKINGRVVILY